MKKYLCIFMVGLLSGCCTKKDCINAFETSEIQLISFNVEDADSIFVASYKSGSNFSAVIDSQLTEARVRGFSDEELIIFLSIELTHKNDYQFYFPKMNKTYEITNIKTDLEKCNTCFLTTDKQLVLSSYEVNGIEQINNFFKIDK